MLIYPYHVQYTLTKDTLRSVKSLNSTLRSVEFSGQYQIHADIMRTIRNAVADWPLISSREIDKETKVNIRNPNQVSWLMPLASVFTHDLTISLL